MAQLLRIPAQRAENIQSTGETAPALSTGWDPYEVWRTRVLLPRLEGDAAPKTDADTQQPPGDPKSVWKLV